MSDYLSCHLLSHDELYEGSLVYLEQKYEFYISILQV